MNTNRPRVIFLDAVGTLFGVRSSVGHVYSEIARQYGVEAPADELNQAFYEVFKRATPMAFPGLDEDEIAEREFGWWWAIAAESFQRIGVLDHFDNFPGFFASLYAHFATPAPWFVYPDVRDSLNYWRDRNIQLGIISNFDSRLYKVLPALGLDSYFASVTISTEIGAAKPSPKIFEAALAKHQCPAQFAWHIGDSFNDDYKAAIALGIRGIWLNRKT